MVTMEGIEWIGVILEAWLFCRQHTEILSIRQLCKPFLATSSWLIRQTGFKNHSVNELVIGTYVIGYVVYPSSEADLQFSVKSHNDWITWEFNKLQMFNKNYKSFQLNYIFILLPHKTTPTHSN